MRRTIGRRALWAGCAFVVGLVVVIAVGLLSGCTSAPPDYAAQDRARAQAAALAPLDTLLAAVWRVVPLTGMVGAMALGGRWALAAVRRYERERTPTPEGVLPVRAEQLGEIAPAALAAAHAVRAAHATRPNVPHVLHYSPRTDTRTAGSGTPAAHVDHDDQDSSKTAALPGPIDLAALNWKPRIDNILLALGAGGVPIVVHARQLCHVALVGATGQGKSAAMRLLLPQLLAIGGRVMLIDPHYADIDPDSGDDWRAIRERLVSPPAATPTAIDGALGYLTDELDRRLTLRREGQPVGPPVWAAIDELPVITDTVPRAMDRLTRVLREGRKVGILAIGASQSMLVRTLGGDATVRDAYRTAYYAGGDQRSGAALLDVATRDIPEGELGKGVILLRSAATQPATMARVPLASNEAIAAMLVREAGREAGREAADSNPLPRRHDAVNAPEPLDIEARRIIERFKAGSTIAEITRELSGANGGKAYQAAAERVSEALRRAL